MKEKYILKDGTKVRGVINSKGWLEWTCRDEDGGVIIGISRPNTFTKVQPKTKGK